MWIDGAGDECVGQSSRVLDEHRAVTRFGEENARRARVNLMLDDDAHSVRRSLSRGAIKQRALRPVRRPAVEDRLLEASESCHVKNRIELACERRSA
jgi:hypothetical protein